MEMLRKHVADVESNRVMEFRIAYVTNVRSIDAVACNRAKFDGVGRGWAITANLHTNTKSKCRTEFTLVLTFNFKMSRHNNFA